MNIESFKKKPILGILRGAKLDMIEPLVEEVISSGLETLEIAMNTQGAAQQIQQAVKCSRGRLMVGAGTVISQKLLKEALDAGATFIVMPALLKDVVQICVKNKIHVFPGALTPMEIFNAWEAGATMVKVFPSGFFGPQYFREIKGPFRDIELLACGGVRAENVKEYFACGASAISFGSSVFKKELLENGRFSAVGGLIKDLLKNIPKDED